MVAAGGELEHGSIEVGGMRRTYWLARAARLAGQRPGAPLLVVLHGSGTDGRVMAGWTGLATRGPAAGARYAEHVARRGLLPVAGLFLVAGTGLEASRQQTPAPAQRATVVVMAGTADRTMPYDGGRLTRRGLSGLVLKRRPARHGELPGEDVVTGAEALARDWASGNGIKSGPAIDELPTQAGDLPVTTRTWTAPGCHPVTLYRIDGGARLAWWPAVPSGADERTDPAAPGRDGHSARLGAAGGRRELRPPRPWPQRSRVTRQDGQAPR